MSINISADTGEMRERYGRDKNNLSRAGIPFYKGDYCDDGRDKGFLSASLFFAATLIAMIGTIVVEFDFHIRLNEFSFAG